MSPQVILQDPEEATVDGISLTKGDIDNPTDLTDDQISRLEAAGAKFQSLEEGEDPIEALKGEALEDAFTNAGLNSSDFSKAADKREALKNLRDYNDPQGSQEGGGQ